MGDETPDVSWAISPRPIPDAPTYYWCGLRLLEADVNHDRLNEIGRQIHQRVVGYDWPFLKVRDGDMEAAQRAYAPIVSTVITEEDKRKASFIAGETLYYLRSTLDHLVYAASWLEQGRPQDNTQFPICETENKWKKQVKDGRLGGMSAQNANRIEAVQPFNGVTWTNHLRMLSNADKHRLGVEVSPTCVFRVDSSRREVDPTEGNVITIPLHSISVPLLLPALGEMIDATTIFTEMFLGVAQLLNLFFADEGLSSIAATKR